MAIKIRQIKRADISALSKLYVRVYTNFDVGERWTVKAAHNLLAYWLRRQPDLCLAAELSGRLVGAFVAGIKPWHDGNHLTDGELFVDPDYQKQGIGSLLSIAMCQKALRKYHATRFDAITFSDRDFPLTWYRDQGFKEVRNWTIISGDIKEVLHHLQKGKIR